MLASWSVPGLVLGYVNHRSDLAVEQFARTMLDRTITELVEERNTVKGIS
jgi:hypothetical protein